MADVFASADECVRRGKLIELRPEGKGAIELSRETKVLFAPFGTVVDEADGAAVFRCGRCCGHSGRTGSDHDYVEVDHMVGTCIPSSAMNAQVRTCGMPFTVAQHSIQIPMAHKGARVHRQRRCGRQGRTSLALLQRLRHVA